MKKKFLIVDGNSLVYRAFYALPLLSNAAGQFTNAVYGFISMFSKILDEEKPDYAVVCFDKGKVTFRTEQFEDYKGHRKPTPEELRPQFPLVKKTLEAMNVAYWELEGFEGDDLIGTLVDYGNKKGLFNIVLTGDKDALQLVSDQCSVLLTRKGISEMERYDEKAVFDRFGLSPAQIIDLKGLMGDPSDNIPGVPGVGEKTAQKLLKQFGTVEKIYDNLEEVSAPKLRQKLADNRELAFLSKSLATIECCVPLKDNLDTYLFEEPDYDRLLEIYRELEFKSLIKGILDRMSKQPDVKLDRQAPDKEPDADFRMLNTVEEIRNVLPSLMEAEKVAVWTKHRGNYFDGDLCAISLALPGGTVYAVFLAGKEEHDKLTVLKELFEKETVSKIVYNAKDLYVMLSQSGISIRGIVSDVMLGAYLLNSSVSDYSLETLSLEYLGRALLTQEDELNSVCSRAGILERLSEEIDKKITGQGMEDLYRQVELPLSQLLAQMEIAGVKVDSGQLKTMSQELEEAIDKVSREIFLLAGEEFNINSPKQLGVILFDKLGLPPVKKTKTGYSTDAGVLEHLAERHEIAAQILEYRMLVKLKSTYVDGMQGLINPGTEKLHTSFNQTVTATGRLSSTEPNLQNIPVRMELGRQIRKVFVPSRPENILLAGDYSQIELRVLAHISKDPVLQEAFWENQDIHARTAAEVFGVPIKDVLPEMRRRAKAVNFGIVYGISDFGLSRDLGISRKEAQKYIDSYFARYPGVAAYMKEIVAEAKKQGFVTTLFNRRRYLPDIQSRNFNVRSFGERTAMNTPIQGSAADIIKVAMVKIYCAMKEKGFLSKMILQVHDELIFDTVPGEVEVLPEMVKELMENAVSLEVPLKVDLKMGRNWYEMKKI